MRLSFLSHHLPTDGYGIAGIQTIAALERLGVEVNAEDMMVLGARASIPGERHWSVQGPAVVLCVPSWWPDVHVRGPFIGYTMFESTRLPEGRVDLINESADLCLVPSEWNKAIFEENGVRVPIRVVPFGINTDDWYPLFRAHNGRPYHFLWSGTPDKRKGWDLAYRAFRLAFGSRKDVQLTMHFREMPYGVSGCADENVRLLEGRFAFQEIRRMIQDADCYVFPSRGEGWGLPPREAAATGIPVIATDWGGLAEDIFQWALALRVKEMRTAEYGFFDAGEVGEWAEPELDHLVELMRWCVADRNAAALIGRQAAKWLARKGTWQNTAMGIIQAVQEVEQC